MRVRAGTGSDLSAILWDGSCGQVIFQEKWLPRLTSSLPLHSRTWLNHQPDCTARSVKKLAWVLPRKVSLPVRHLLSSWRLPSRHSGSASLQGFRDNHQGSSYCSLFEQRPSRDPQYSHVCVCMCTGAVETFLSNACKRSSKTIFFWEKHVHILGIWNLLRSI